MVGSEKLLQATLNRLSTRIGEKLINSVNNLETLIKTTPEKLRDEWELFQQEVFEEAERLEKKSNIETSETNKQSAKDSALDTPREKINQIRTKIVEISNKLEASN